MTPTERAGRTPLRPPVQRETLAGARPLVGLAARRAALLADIERSEAARAEAAAQERATPLRAPGGSRQRRILRLQRENQELRQEIAELKRFLVEVGQSL
jgi:hypothetical protein